MHTNSEWCLIESFMSTNALFTDYPHALTFHLEEKNIYIYDQAATLCHGPSEEQMIEDNSKMTLT